MFLQFDPLTGQLFFFTAFIGIVYMFFLRPQVKKQKAQDQFVVDLSKGSEVVTASGIIGKINKIDSQSIQLELGPKNFISVIPSSISKEMTEHYLKRKLEN